MQISANSAYCQMLPMRQRIIRSPHDGNAVLEGCGPIALAMLLVFWAARGNRLLDDFDGRRHSRADIVRRLYILVGARRVHSYKTFTPPAGLFFGMRRAAVGTTLEAHHLSKPWRLVRRVLCHQIRRQRPVIILLRNIPACLNFNEEASAGCHYVVACGFDNRDGNVALITGWGEGDKRSTYGFGAHRRASAENYDTAHAASTLNELRRAHISLFWNAPRKNTCNTSLSTAQGEVVS